MNKVQLDNLMVFSFLFVQNHITTYDPTYICEKWDSFIDIDDIKILETKRPDSFKYEGLWGEIEDNTVYTKVYICIRLEMLKDGKSFFLPNIIELFEEFVDLDNITLRESMHFHPILHDYIEEWGSYPINMETYKTYLRDDAIDSLISD